MPETDRDGVLECQQGIYVKFILDEREKKTQPQARSANNGTAQLDSRG